MPRGSVHHGGYRKHLDRGVIPAPTEERYLAELGPPPVPPAERNADTALRPRTAIAVSP